MHIFMQETTLPWNMERKYEKIENNNAIATSAKHANPASRLFQNGKAENRKRENQHLQKLIPKIPTKHHQKAA